MPRGHVVAVGASFKTAPLAARERLAIGADEAPEALHYLREYTQEALVLSTCNRTELYLVATDVRQALYAATSLFTARSGIPSEDLEPGLYALCDEAAVRHLLNVAAGMDSLVPGEHEILGQIRGAVRLAQAGRSLGPVLGRLTQTALRTGKRARTETAIGRHPASVSLAAVRLAREALAPLEERTALIVGAGKTARLAAQALRSHKVGALRITSRTLAKAQALAAEAGGSAAGIDELPRLLAEADIVISCSSSNDVILTSGAVAAALGAAPRRHRLILDLAVPRDVEPQVRELMGVTLYDLDDLQGICQRNQAARREAQAEVDAIVVAETEVFQRWVASRETAESVGRLRVWADAVARAEVEKTLRHCPDLSPEEREHMEAMAQAVVNKLLHVPTIHLKALAAQDASRTLREVFALDPLDGSVQLRRLLESTAERVNHA